MNYYYYETPTSVIVDEWKYTGFGMTSGQHFQVMEERSNRHIKEQILSPSKPPKR